MDMLSLAVVIGFPLFFFAVLCLCVRNPMRDMDARPRSYTDVTPRSPLGRWRY